MFRPVLSLLMILTAGAASAQEGPLVYAGQPHYGSIVSYDQPIWGRGGFKTFWVDLAAGRGYRFTVESGTLDTHVTVARAVNGVTEVLAEADGGGTGTDAALNWTPPSTGRYLLIAQSARRGEVGNFTLRIQDAGVQGPPPPPSIRIGQESSGRLDRDDPRLTTDGSYFDEIAFSARQGQRLLIDMRSADFDAYLHVGRRTSAGQWQSLGADDDGLGQGTDSRIRFLVPGDGQYRLLANTRLPGQTGRYTLSIREAPPGPRPTPAPIAAGATVAGSLGESDAIVANSWTFYDLFSFEGRAGQRVEFALTGTGFLPTLELGTMFGSIFTRITRETAARPGSTVVLRATLTRNGSYYLRVRSAADLQTGTYSLENRIPAPTGPAVPNLPRDRTRPVPDSAEARPSVLVPVDSAATQVP